MTDTVDLGLRLALATVPCPDDGEDVSMSHEGVHTEWGYRRFQDHPHAACGGTGRVPWLKGVRVTCFCYGFYRKGEIGAEWHKSANGIKAALRKRNPIVDCGGRGFTISEDTEVWLEAARPEMVKRGWVLLPIAGGGMVGELEYTLPIAEAPTVKEALQLALATVVPT